MADQPPPGTKKRYPNSGILSRADPQRLEANPKAPPYSGSLDIDCPHCKAIIEMWIGAYVNEFRDGKKYFKLSFNPKNAGPKGPKPPVVQTQARPAPAPAPAPEQKPHMEPSPATDEDFRY